MLSRFKKMINKDSHDEDKQTVDKTENKIKELQGEKERLAQEIEKLQKFSENKKVLLPFEKKELLKKEIELLESKKCITLEKINKKRKIDGSSKNLDYIVVKIREEIENKKDEIKEVREQGKSIRVKASNDNFTLEKDPRIEIKQELDSQKKYKKIINFIDEHKKILKQLNRNKKNIINQVEPINKGEVQQRLITVSREDKRKIGRVRKTYKKNINKGLENKLQLVEKELERVRQDMIDQEELKV